MDNTTRAGRAARLLESGNSLQAVSCNLSFFLRSGTYQAPNRVRPRTRRIQVKLSVKGISAVRSTGVECLDKARFDTQTLSLQDDPVNTHRLVGLKNQIHHIFNQRLLTQRSLNPALILDIALGIATHEDEDHYVMGRDNKGRAVLSQLVQKPKALSVQEALSRYVAQKEKLLGNGLCARSVYQYQKYGRKLTEFVTHCYGKNWPLSYLTPSVEFDLYAYFKGKQKQAHNYIIKVMQFFKVALSFAHAHGWVDRNVMGAVRFKKERRPVHILTLAEIEVLAKGQLGDETLDQVRDVFLFQVYTGLAWTDVHSLAAHHIIRVQGVDCIQKERDKSGQQAFVPLFPEAIAILNKYAHHPICQLKRVLLPVLHNATMNRELKTIGQQLGIAQKLHTHLARKSFTFFVEKRGFTLDEMATMMGHSHATMTEKHYHVRRQEPILETFRKLYGEATIMRLAS